MIISALIWQCYKLITSYKLIMIKTLKEINIGCNFQRTVCGCIARIYIGPQPIDKTAASCLSQQGLNGAVKTPFEIDNYHFFAYGFY